MLLTIEAVLDAVGGDPCFLIQLAAAGRRGHAQVGPVSIRGHCGCPYGGVDRCEKPGLKRCAKGASSMLGYEAGEWIAMQAANDWSPALMQIGLWW